MQAGRRHASRQGTPAGRAGCDLCLAPYARRKRAHCTKVVSLVLGVLQGPDRHGFQLPNRTVVSSLNVQATPLTAFTPDAPLRRILEGNRWSGKPENLELKLRTPLQSHPRPRLGWLHPYGSPAGGCMCAVWLATQASTACHGPGSKPRRPAGSLDAAEQCSTLEKAPGPAARHCSCVRPAGHWRREPASVLDHWAGRDARVAADVALDAALGAAGSKHGPERQRPVSGLHGAATCSRPRASLRKSRGARARQARTLPVRRVARPGRAAARGALTPRPRHARPTKEGQRWLPRQRQLCSCTCGGLADCCCPISLLLARNRMVTKMANGNGDCPVDRKAMQSTKRVCRSLTWNPVAA